MKNVGFFNSFKVVVKYSFLSIIPPLFLFLLMEVTLRVTGFRYSHTPMEMRQINLERMGMAQETIDGNNRDGVIRFIKDSKQLWVPVQPFGDGYSVKKRPNVIRIATLGDSCTADCVDTEATYPGIMEDILEAKSPNKVKVLNAGVGSYSSFQGLQRLKHAVLRYEPDIITIHFGWNDHWLTPREDKNVKMPGEFMTLMVNFAEQFRIYQLMNYAITKTRDRAKKIQPRLRVHVDDYRNNLHTMIDIAEDRRMKAVLITAPSDFTNFPFRPFWPLSEKLLINIHKQYNQVVRSVAHERNVPLVDLVALVTQQEEKRIMSRDGIHFTPIGCRFVAEAIADKILTEKML